MKNSRKNALQKEEMGHFTWQVALVRQSHMLTLVMTNTQPPSPLYPLSYCQVNCQKNHSLKQNLSVTQLEYKSEMSETMALVIWLHWSFQSPTFSLPLRLSESMSRSPTCCFMHPHLFVPSSNFVPPSLSGKAYSSFMCLPMCHFLGVFFLGELSLSLFLPHLPSLWEGTYQSQRVS